MVQNTDISTFLYQQQDPLTYFCAVGDFLFLTYTVLFCWVFFFSFSLRLFVYQVLYVDFTVKPPCIVLLVITGMLADLADGTFKFPRTQKKHNKAQEIREGSKCCAVFVTLPVGVWLILVASTAIPIYWGKCHRMTAQCLWRLYCYCHCVCVYNNVWIWDWDWLFCHCCQPQNLHFSRIFVKRWLLGSLKFHNMDIFSP